MKLTAPTLALAAALLTAAASPGAHAAGNAPARAASPAQADPRAPLAVRDEGVTETLRVGGELKYRDLYLRLAKVLANEPNDATDDAMLVIVRTPATGVDQTIRKKRSARVEEYEIRALDIVPDPAVAGQGTATIQVLYKP